MLLARRLVTSAEEAAEPSWKESAQDLNPEAILVKTSSSPRRPRHPSGNTNGRREVIGDGKYSVNVNGTEATRKLEIFIEHVIVEHEGKNPALTDLKRTELKHIRMIEQGSLE